MPTAELERELATRGVPYSPEEFGWARRREPQHRVPPPVVGQRVYWRPQRWAYGQELPAVVVEAPDLTRRWRWEELQEDSELDTNVWALCKHPNGQLRYDGLGLPVVEVLPDPWPLVRLRISGRVTLDLTREARLRGSAGWLPLDWRERWRPGPQFGWPEVGRGLALPPGLKHVRTDAQGRML